jgi:hypothetical protein
MHRLAWSWSRIDTGTRRWRLYWKFTGFVKPLPAVLLSGSRRSVAGVSGGQHRVEPEHAPVIGHDHVEDPGILQVDPARARNSWE